MTMRICSLRWVFGLALLVASVAPVPQSVSAETGAAPDQQIVAVVNADPITRQSLANETILRFGRDDQSSLDLSSV
jgi:hypothetical protein